jgi:hypothetical protein
VFRAEADTTLNTEYGASIVFELFILMETAAPNHTRRLRIMRVPLFPEMSPHA